MNIALVTALLLSQATDTYKIVNTFKEGEARKYTIIRAQDEDSPMGMGMGGTWSIELKVESVKDGETKIKAVRTAVKLDAEDNAMMPEDAIAMMKKPSEMTISIKNNKIEVSREEKLRGMVMGATDWSDDVLFSPPDKPLKPGDSWTLKQKNESQGVGKNKLNGETSTTYTFIGPDKLDGADCYKLTMVVKGSSVGEAHFSIGAPDGDAQTVEIKIDRDAKYVIHVSPEDGRVLKKVGHEETHMSAEGSEFPMDHTTSMTVEVKPAK